MIPNIAGIIKKAEIKLAKNWINILPDTFFQRYNTTCNTKGEPLNERILQIFLHGWGLLTGKAEGAKSRRRGVGHCVIKWILCRHLKPPPKCNVGTPKIWIFKLETHLVYKLHFKVLTISR